ncbi:MAG: 16S rRNA (guanine(966)-N(2))-methyltransferase RsmD [Lachnospiraceae bacterium]
MYVFISRRRNKMRVVAGSARSILLETPAGKETRPTTDRIKETLFNMLQPYVPGSVVLDLFAGSGALGIEALSRGADYACFVDMSREAVRCITGNVRRARLEERSDVLLMDYRNAISGLRAKGKTFDLVFLDPPYGRELEYQALELLDENGLLADDALIVVETALEHDFEPFIRMGFSVERIKVYKSNQHYFLTKKV